MLKIDSSALQKQLLKLKSQVEMKLEGMVREFSYNVADQAITNTPLGDSDKNWEWYLKRIEDKKWQSYGLLPDEGFAQGSWQVVTSKSSVSLNQVDNYGKNSDQAALSSVKSNMTSYQLGNIVIIGNKGPYIMNLENNYSDQTNGQGIMKPTLQIIQAVYSTQLKVYYDRGMV